MSPRQIAISATNPCHLYDAAVALHAQGALSAFHSGYPRWRLHPPADFPLVAHSARTVATYAALHLPTAVRPANHRLFRWQDTGFDRAVANALRPSDAKIIHAMPGQARATFSRAQELGMKTVLNHASGPVRQQLALVADEYRRARVPLEQHHGFDAAYFAREEEEYARADYHCVASSIVSRQLQAEGVDVSRIWVVPYGANPQIFFPPPNHSRRDLTRIVYAGQLTLRKGLRVLFEAMEEVQKSFPASLHLYGRAQPDFVADLSRVRDRSWIEVHGAVTQAQLAEIFREASMLVLPSWEEAFGLVVVQALNCGLPCIVSDRVGARDLIEPGKNGSIFGAGDSQGLEREISHWLSQPRSFLGQSLTWEEPARQLLAHTDRALNR